MKKLIRYGVSIDKELQDKVDALLEKKGYKNRSEAIRDLFREKLISEAHEDKSSLGMGTISIVYDHHIPELSSKLTEIQHDLQDIVIASTHVHIDHHNCMEVIMVKGVLAQLEQLANRLSVVKGVKTGKLTIAY